MHNTVLRAVWRCRYVEWADKKGVAAARELYGLQNGPQEDANVAGRKGNGNVLDELSRLLQATGRTADVLPPILPQSVC